jgi:four helix bundle protein
MGGRRAAGSLQPAAGSLQPTACSGRNEVICHPAGSMDRSGFMGTRSFRRLLAWQRAMDLVMTTYALTRTLPIDERFGLVSQMRRAAVSVACNISEGKLRDSDREFRRFLGISLGSLAELETQVELVRRLELAGPPATDEALAGIGDVARLIEALRRALA